MSQDARRHPNAPCNQPFMGAPMKKKNHWSNKAPYHNNPINHRKKSD